MRGAGGVLKTLPPKKNDDDDERFLLRAVVDAVDCRLL